MSKASEGQRLQRKEARAKRLRANKAEMQSRIRPGRAGRPLRDDEEFGITWDEELGIPVLHLPPGTYL